MTGVRRSKQVSPELLHRSLGCGTPMMWLSLCHSLSTCRHRQECGRARTDRYSRVGFGKGLLSLSPRDAVGLWATDRVAIALVEL